MAAPVVTVSSKGQIVIPAEIRKSYGIEPGQKFVVVDMGDHISLVPAVDDPIRHLRGILKDTGFTMDDFMEERRREREAEDEKMRQWKR